MIQFFKKLFFKNRENHRHLVHKGSFVVIAPTNDGTEIKWKVNVIDISLGGAAFIYEGSPDDLAKSGLIRFANDAPEAVKFETVSDVEYSEGSTHRRRGVKFERECGYRRCGDKFEWLGVLGEKHIHKFIQEHGLPAGGIHKKEIKAI